MSRRRSWAADEAGGSAVEFSLVLTAFCLMVFGVVEYGRYMWTANVLQQTAIQTARCMGMLQTNCVASHAYSSTNATAYAQSVSSGLGVTIPTADFSLSHGATCAGAANLSQVTITYTYQSALPGLLPGISAAPLTESACFPNQT
jgi:Flp pilus assembly protein TadG